MTNYQFSVIIEVEQLSEQAILDATDALGTAGCLDASISGHPDGMELTFHRDGESLQDAITSAIRDVEQAGFRVARLEMERRAIPV